MDTEEMTDAEIEYLAENSTMEVEMFKDSTYWE